MPFGNDLLAHMRDVQIMPNSLAIWGLGQLGIAIKGPDAIIYIDPCLSDVVRDLLGDWWVRAYDPPILPQDITNATYVLSSHEHLDHLDPQTVGPLAKASPDAKFIVTGWSLDIMANLDIGDERIIVPKASEEMTLPGTSIKLWAVPGAHYDCEYDDAKGYRWFGYLIEWNGVRFFHSGDTIIYPEYLESLAKLPPIDVGMLPVNGRDWYRETEVGAIGNLLPAEAARIARDLKWDILIPGHNDMYPNNAIPNAQIVDALERIAPRQKYKFLQPGELYYYVK